MSKVIGIFDKEVTPVAFVSVENGKNKFEVIDKVSAESIDHIMRQIVDTNNVILPLRQEVVDDNGKIIFGSKVVASEDPEYIDALAEIIHSAAGLLTAEIFAETKQLLVDLGRSPLPQEQKDRLFASIINMSEEDVVEVVNAYREIVLMNEDLKKVDKEWEEAVEKIKGRDII